MRTMLALAIALTVGGCVTNGSTPVTTVTVCSTIRSWSVSEQAQLRAELANAGPQTQRALREFVSLRDQARACLARGKKK